MDIYTIIILVCIVVAIIFYFKSGRIIEQSTEEDIEMFDIDEQPEYTENHIVYKNDDKNYKYSVNPNFINNQFHPDYAHVLTAWLW